MTDDIICPYFGVDEDLCDVGCGYISPSDVHQIIRFCRAQHTQCPRFQQLRAGFSSGRGGQRPRGDCPPQAARQMDTAPAAHPQSATLALNRTSGAAALSRGTAQAANAAPATLGLLGAGMNIFLLAAQQAALLPLDALTLALGLFYGGLAQVLSGIFAWRRNQSLVATAFCAWGLFWLTLVGMLALPRAGIGDLPSSLALTSYLAFWVLFGVVLFFAALRLGRLLPLIFANLSLFLFLLALSETIASPALDQLAGWQGVLTALLAFYAGCAQLLNDAYRRPLLPT